MASFNLKHWITDPEYTDFLNYIIEQTRNVEAPMNAQRLAREFKEKSGAAQAGECLKQRIYSLRTKIHIFEHIDTYTKVKMMFALSAPVNPNFLKELKEDALVEVDDKQRITHYKSNDESLELKGVHNSLAKNRNGKLESKQSIRSMIIGYFENNNGSNSVPKNEKEKEIWKLIEFITEKCENVNTPLSIQQLVKDFKNHFGISKQIRSIEKRVDEYRREIQALEFLDTPSKVKQLFGLNARLDSNLLNELRKDALVDVDEKNRIVYYKANDGRLELRGDHSQSAKKKIVSFESKRKFRNVIIDYFENKNDIDAVPNNDETKEMWNFIGFIIEKCENVNSPLNITRVAIDFYNHFGIARSSRCISKRVEAYCREIQTMKFLDTPSKVKQLFCLSGTLNSNFLTELRKDAVVEVDDLNRITKYAANDGRLTLHGDHSSSAKQMLALNERKRKRNAVTNYCNFGDDDDEKSENEIVHSEDDSDEYSGEELDFEDDNKHLDKSEDLMEPSNGVHDEMKEEDGSKRKNSSPTTPTSEKKRNKGTTGFSSSNWTESFSNNSMRPNEMDDYDTNHSIDDQFKSEPVFGSIQDDLNEIEEDEGFQQVLKPLQALNEQDQIEEVTIKIEIEEPVEVKPETSHNPKIKFFDAMQSLIACLDTPSLSWIQSKIHQKIQNLRESDEVILNKNIVLIIDLLIARMTNHSVEILSKSVESVNLSYFLCYLKAAIQISKLSGVDVLVKNISKLIEESHNKRIPMEKVANALCATLDIDSF